MRNKIGVYKLMIATLLMLLALSLVSNVLLILADNKTDAPHKTARETRDGANKDPEGIIAEQEETSLAEEKQPKTESEEVLYYDVPLSHKLQDYLRERCAEYGIDMKLALAVAKVESGFVADSVSETGDYGIMQINAVNHSWLSGMLDINDYLDPYQNFEAGLYMLNHAFLNGDTSHKALMVYNMGFTGASELWEQGITETVYSHAVMQVYEEIEAKNESDIKISGQ